MKKLNWLVIIFLVSCAIKQSTTTTNHCNEFERELGKYYIIGSKTQKNTSSSDSLIQDLKTKYESCLIGKDTTYIIEKFGRKYNMWARKPLKYELEYLISTPKYPLLDPKPGLTVTFGINDSNIVKSIDVGVATTQGYK